MVEHEVTADAVHLRRLSHWVHILALLNGKSYGGCINDIREYSKCHSLGYVSFTRHKRPVQTVWVIGFQDKYKAFEFGKYLKSGPGRAFKGKQLF